MAVNTYTSVVLHQEELRLEDTEEYLGVQCTLQGSLLHAVLDFWVCPILQEHLDDPLVAPASSNVQGSVSLLIANIQSAGMHIIVHQSLDTLGRKGKLSINYSVVSQFRQQAQS